MAGSDNVSNADILKILKEIKEGNEEIKTDIKQIKEDLSQQTDKVRKLNARIDTLEFQNKELREKLLDTQRRTRRNNLVVFGIPEEENLKNYLVTTFKEKLQVELEETDINNIYRVGVAIKENKPRAVILELVRNIKKQEIFQKVSNLKGSNISIANDLTQDEREKHQVLYRHLKLAKEKQYHAKIVKNKLVINGEIFTYEQLKDKEGDENTAIKQTHHLREICSAPNTPTTKNESGLDIEKANIEKKENKTESNQILNQESSAKSIITRSAKKPSDTSLSPLHAKKTKKIN